MMDEHLVGVYYFAGWWRGEGSKYVVDGKDWTKDYPERLPLLGNYNDQETMDKEILAARDGKVDFFQILWYTPGRDATPGSEHLNDGVKTFLASKNNGKLRFVMEFCNHPPFGIEDDAEWEKYGQEWARILKHPSYLKLDGRPVFKIHGLDYFLRQNGGDPTRVARRIANFRAVCKDAGAGDPIISAGVMPGGVPPVANVHPYDFLTTYMDVPNVPTREKPPLHSTPGAGGRGLEALCGAQRDRLRPLSGSRLGPPPLERPAPIF